MQNPMGVSIYQQIKKYFLIAMVALLSASAILGISLILFGTGSVMMLRIIGTAATLGFSALLMAGQVARLDGRPLVRVLAWVALVTNFLAMLYLILGIWGVFSEDCSGATHYHTCLTSWQNFMEAITKIFLICLNITLSLSIIGRFLTYRLRSQAVKVVCCATIAITAILAVIFTCLTVFDISLNETLIKVIIVLGILLVLGLIIVPILMAVERSHERQVLRDMAQPEDEQALRKRIEQEVRAKIAAEQAQKKTSEKEGEKS